MAPHSPEIVAVLVGGEPVEPALRDELGVVDHVIAADSGLYVARRLGLAVDLLVGDLDSVDAADLAHASFEIDRHPRAKDQTDIALALDLALALHPRCIVVVTGGGGRLDHAIANLLTLAAPEYTDVQIDAYVGNARVAVIRSERELSGAEGELISLFAVGGPARGVTTTGLRYVLHDDLLPPLSSRGVSNEFVGGPATINLTAGTLLAIRPGPQSR